MGKGSSSSAPQTQYVKTETSSLPSYAQPYYEKLMANANAETLNSTYQPYQDASGNPINRIADFTPAQQWAMNNQMQATGPSQFGDATQLAQAAGLGSLNASQYQPGQFSAQQIGQPNVRTFNMQNPGNVQGTNTQAAQMQAAPNVQAGTYAGLTMQGPADIQTQQYGSPEMQANRTSYGDSLSNLNSFQQGAPDKFGQAQADEYMSPYQQSVVDIQKREATRDAKQGQLVQDLGAARQGTYGGSRQLLAGLERERNLGQQLGDIQQKGSQSAYENAQQQFERDRAAGLGVANANQQASLQTQGLQTQAGMQAALANLSSADQASVQNMAAKLQTQGLNADQALKAAMSNQQMGFNTGQQNLQAGMQAQNLNSQNYMQAALNNYQGQMTANQQNMAANNTMYGQNADNYMKAQLANQQMGFNVGQANQQGQYGAQQLATNAGLDALKSNQQYNLQAQQLGEQSRQFGAQNALQGYGQAGNQAQTMINAGQAQFQTDQALRDNQFKTASYDQALQQQYMDQQYGDFLRQSGYPLEMLQQYSSLLRGVPVTPSTQTTESAPRPSLASQIIGTGVGAAGLYKTLGG